MICMNSFKRGFSPFAGLTQLKGFHPSFLDVEDCRLIGPRDGA